MTTRKIRACPRCGCTQLREAKSSVGGWLVPTTYYCESEGCGYSGPVYVEIDPEEVENFQQVINGTELEHDSKLS